jgi:DNA-binding MarR family transcriptional regulator
MRGTLKTQVPELHVSERNPDADFALGPLETSIAFLLRSAYDASAAAFERRAAHLAVSAGEFASLTVIHANPGITQGQLSVATGRHMSTLTPIMRDFEQRGFITRTTVPGDRRSSAITLTKRGCERLRDITEVAQQHEIELDRIVGKQNKALLIRQLRRIRALLA